MCDFNTVDGLKEKCDTCNHFIKSQRICKILGDRPDLPCPLNEDLQKLIEIIKDPPVYSIPFLGDPSDHIQSYRRAMDAWYCKILNQIRILEEKQ